MAIYPLQFLNVLVDIVPISTENRASIAVFRDVLIDTLEILTDLKTYSSVVATVSRQSVQLLESVFTIGL